MSGKKLPFGARFGLAILSFVLGLLLFVSAVVTLLIANIRVVTSENNIRQITKLLLGAPQQVHSVAQVTPGAVGAGLRMEEESDLGGAVTEGLVGFLYEGLKDFLGENMTMNLEELQDVVDRSTVKDFIADKTAGLVTDYILGEVTTTISGEEIKQLLVENKELIEQVTGQEMPTEMIDDIMTVVEENPVIQKLEEEGLAGFIEEITGEALPEGSLGELKPKDPNALGNQIFGEDMGGTIAGIAGTITGGELEGISSISDVLTVFRAATSVGKLLLFIGISLVLVGLIIVVNIKQLPKGLRRGGLPLVFAGFGFLGNLVALFVPALFTISPLPIVRQILVMTAGANGAVFGLGLALIIAGFVLGSVAKKNAAKAAAAALEEAAIAEIAEEAAEEAAEAAEEAEEIPEEPAEEAEEAPEAPVEACEEEKEAEPQEI